MELEFQAVEKFHGWGIFKTYTKPWLLLLNYFVNWVFLKMSAPPYLTYVFYYSTVTEIRGTVKHVLI